MELPLQITLHGIERSGAIDAAVRRKVEGLQHFTDSIQRCHVIIDAPHRRHHKEKHCQVRVDLILHGAETIVSIADNHEVRADLDRKSVV